MNKIESLVYNLVRKNPALKQAVRNLYQSIFDLLPRKKNYFSGNIDNKENYFFGFHDISPISSDDSKILANRLSFDLRMPIEGEDLEVGYFELMDGKLGEWHKLGVSKAWNYHKGCRLQWLEQDVVIFNSAKDKDLCSQIIDFRDFQSKTLADPIDAVYVGNGEKIATSFSYERLERCMPGYGYPYKDNGFVAEPHPKETGLFLVDLESGEKELLVSLDDLSMSLSPELREGCLHFVTHTEFSHDGRYVSFLYRRIPIEGDYMRRWTQIRVYDRKTKTVITLPSQDSGSHYVWNNYNQMIVSCFMDGKNCHVLFDMNDLEHPIVVAGDILNSDGHQSWISDTEFVTDTYPDRRRMAKIYRVNIQTQRNQLIASIYSPKKFQTKDFKCHIACDLHPRVSKSGKYVCFDSPTSGKRGLYIMKLDGISVKHFATRTSGLTHL